MFLIISYPQVNHVVFENICHLGINKAFIVYILVVTHLGQHEISGAQEIIFTSVVAVPIIHNEGQHGLLDYTTSKIHVKLYLEVNI